MVRILLIVIFAIAWCSCGNDKRTEKHASEIAFLEDVVHDVADDLRALGFPLDLSEVSIDVKDKAEMAELFNSISSESRRDLNNYTPFGPSSLGEEVDSTDRSSERLAFYDPNSKSIVFRQGALDVLTKGYLAHELAHVYQDQEWDFSSVWRAYNEKPTREQFNITQFIIEGHAELLRNAYEQNHVSAKDATEMGVALGKMSENDCIPCHTQQSYSTLPYVFGMHFLVNQYRLGGWSKVESFFESFPSSTEQIIHANKFPKDEPIHLSLPVWEDASLPAKPVQNGILGEGYLLAKLLSMPISSEKAFQAASGWDGDVAQLYRLDDGREVSLWRILFDRELDARQLEDAIGILGKDDHVFRVGRVVDWITTKHPDLYRSVRLFLSKHPVRVEEDSVDEQSTIEQERLIAHDAKLLADPYSVPRLVIKPKR